MHLVGQVLEITVTDMAPFVQRVLSDYFLNFYLYESLDNSKKI